MNPLIAAILTFSFIALSHAFPWRIIRPLWDSNGLKRIPSYAVGSGIILIGFLAWCLSTGEYVPFIILAILDFAGALGAIIPRIVKWIDEQLKLADKLHVYETADTARTSDEGRPR